MPLVRQNCRPHVSPRQWMLCSSLRERQASTPCPQSGTYSRTRPSRKCMDLYLGVDHTFTEMYRNWITFEWGRLEQRLRSYVDQAYQGDTASAYTPFGRWIALRLNTYLSELSRSGRYLHGGAALPELARFATLIALRENPFPQLPDKYLSPPAGGGQPTGGGGDSTIPRPPGPPAPPGADCAGTRVKPSSLSACARRLCASSRRRPEGNTAQYAPVSMHWGIVTPTAALTLLTQH